MRYHKTNLGKFGVHVPTDFQGYTYTTAREWLPHCPADEPDPIAWAEDMARRADDELATAADALEAWQQDREP